MIGGKPRRQYYWELREFRQCAMEAFKERPHPQSQLIYFFKKGIPEVIVRVNEPLEKVHSWTFRELEVLQRLNDNPLVFHWKHVYLPLPGELLLHHLEAFNRLLKEEIEEAVPKRTEALQRWINAPLDDVYLVSLKAEQGSDPERAIFQIKTLCRSRYKNYLEMRSWRAPSWEGLLEVAEKEKLSRNSSFGCQLEEANQVINAIDSYQIDEMLGLDSKRKLSAPEKDKYGQKKLLLRTISQK